MTRRHCRAIPGKTEEHAPADVVARCHGFDYICCIDCSLRGRTHEICVSHRGRHDGLVPATSRDTIAAREGGCQVEWLSTRGKLMSSWLWIKRITLASS